MKRGSYGRFLRFSTTAELMILGEKAICRGPILTPFGITIGVPGTHLVGPSCWGFSILANLYLYLVRLIIDYTCKTNDSGIFSNI